ncbi:two-component sensor histidine kinase [Limnohabitans curvus]|uniref:Sensor protein n=1 Tax=Limnohabitans curvus TaxID=323423 RepID=A0A315ENZ2_9BURK|nr:heavy metal sensor histidine kinase [Limnohabitans curvus]PUE58548.1 two-component sensor histidine kinase [Limnohabitans curvus]
MFRSLSLTSRLTIFFTLVAAAVVMGLGWLLMSAADRHFLDLDRVALTDKRQLIEGILSDVNSAEDARRRLGESLNHHHGLLTFIRSSSGKTLYQSDGFNPPEKSLQHAHTKDGQELKTWRDKTTEFHAVEFQAKAKYVQDEDFVIFLAIDAEHHQEFMNELERNLAMYAVLATVVSGFLGWIAAHQGLAPLRAMKARAAEVTGQQLQERMPEEAVPIEMADLARELNQMLDRLQNDFQRLSEFSSDLAHELRTPISNLLTQTQVTLSTKRDVTTYRDVLASNAEELQRLGRIVSDMLFLAKTERSVELPHKEKFSATTEILSLCEFYEALAEEKHISLSTHGDREILGDRLMFRRAISNLLSNALRHTPEGGVVTVSVVDMGSITEVRVENTGSEIDPQVLPRLFDRFFRADPARSHPESDGAGLGLAITKAIAEVHGGTATVTSNHGRTRFSLQFPHLMNDVG